MIRKLKRNFILTNMLLIFIILITIFIGLITYTKRELVKESNDLLRQVVDVKATDDSLRWNLDDHPATGTKHGHYADSNYLMTFVLVLDSEDSIVNVVNEQNLDYSDESFLENLASECLESNKTTGVTQDGKLRYLIHPHDSYTNIAFIDRVGEAKQITNLIKTCIIVMLLALGAFFLISVFLANKIVRPIEVSLTQQQQFVANASHELKTPLTIMLANLDIINSHPNDTIESQQKWLHYIREELKRTTSLVNALLTLAKSDYHKQLPPLTRLNFSELILSAYLPFESLAYEKEKYLDSNIADDIIVLGDQKKLTELFIILMDNALKYSNPKGGIDVTLTATASKAYLSIHNTTEHPIEQIQQKRIFERFYRTDESRSRDQGGFGLGLSIAESIVTSHHGKITVDSSLQEGTTFTVILPIAN